MPFFGAVTGQFLVDAPMASPPFIAPRSLKRLHIMQHDAHALKSALRPLLPGFVRNAWARWRRRQTQRANEGRSAEEVFTSIYRNNTWGGVVGEFCSGAGTADTHIAAAYVNAIAELAQREHFVGARFVDLGCGDFRIGSELRRLCSDYIGVDIVKPLIARNVEVYGNTHTRFLHHDIIRQDLPAGDVCFVRQVFQHLSNREIQDVLPKLKKYRWVLITEHYPRENSDTHPNLDKVHGGDIRAYDNSGVYLDQPPFSLPSDALELILEVDGTGLGQDTPPVSCAPFFIGRCFTTIHEDTRTTPEFLPHRSSRFGPGAAARSLFHQPPAYLSRRANGRCTLHLTRHRHDSASITSENGGCVG